MPRIEETYIHFTEALERNEAIVCNNTGVWRRENALISFVRRLIWGENRRLADIGSAFCSCLDQLEHVQLTFSQNQGDNHGANRRLFADYSRAAVAVQQALALASSSSPLVKTQLDRLALRVVALRYRFEAVHGGADAQPAQNSNEHVFLLDDHGQELPVPANEDPLVDLASEWKKKQILLSNKDLSNRDRERLKEACRYPEFKDLLITDKKLRDSFFTWTMRYNNDVAPFVEFPGTSERIKVAHLAVRVGRFASNLFRIEKSELSPGTTEKVVTLPFYSLDSPYRPGRVKQINILDETKEVDLSHGLRLSIKKILDIFVNKNQDDGDLEFFGSMGITNWNSRALGSKNPLTGKYECVDLTQPNWWEALPVFEELSKDQVQQKYRTGLAEGEWIFCAKASRQTQDLAYEERHGYMEVVVPVGGDRFRVLPMGLFVEGRYPNSAWELLCSLLNTVRGKISYPDENVFYTHREHAHHPIKLSAEEGAELMKQLQVDLSKARKRNMTFQFSSENCAAWVMSVLDRVIGPRTPNPRMVNLFKSPFLGSTPSHPVIRAIINLIKKAPTFMQPRLVWGLDFVLGSWRGITVIEDGKSVYKSARNNPHRATLTIFQAGLLHQQIVNKELAGFITCGH